MTDNKKFIADVTQFANKTADQMLRVAKQSIQDTVRAAQVPVAQGGDMPVDTGFLRNSVTASILGGASASGNPDAGKNSETSNDAVILALSSLELGDPFQVAWTAEYAIARHYMVGVGQGGGLWRDKAAQNWSTVVAKNVRLVQ